MFFLTLIFSNFAFSQTAENDEKKQGEFVSTKKELETFSQEEMRKIGNAAIKKQRDEFIQKNEASNARLRGFNNNDLDDNSFEYQEQGKGTNSFSQGN